MPNQSDELSNAADVQHVVVGPSQEGSNQNSAYLHRGFMVASAAAVFATMTSKAAAQGFGLNIQPSSITFPAQSYAVQSMPQLLAVFSTGSTSVSASDLSLVCTDPDFIVTTVPSSSSAFVVGSVVTLGVAYYPQYYNNASPGQVVGANTVQHALINIYYQNSASPFAQCPLTGSYINTPPQGDPPIPFTPPDVWPLIPYENLQYMPIPTDDLQDDMYKMEQAEMLADQMQDLYQEAMQNAQDLADQYTNDLNNGADADTLANDLAAVNSAANTANEWGALASAAEQAAANAEETYYSTYNDFNGYYQ